MSSYSDTADGVMIDRARAVAECRKHGLVVSAWEDWEAAEFEALFDTEGLCDAGALLRWLGY